MVSLLASIGLLASMSAVGVLALQRYARHLSPLEQVAYGAPIGMTAGTLAMVPLAAVLGFRAEVVIVVGLACAFIAAWVKVGSGLFSGEVGERLADRVAARRSARGEGPVASAVARVRALPRATLIAIVVLGALAIRWAIFWRDAVFYRADGLWAGHINIWGDWSVHLGIVSSFVYGANFPPEHPRFADHPFGYHYLADLTAAAEVTLGMAPTDALALHSFVGCVLVAVALFAFARRLTRNTSAATLAVVLFLFGGGFGWWATAVRIGETGDLFGTLGRIAWDRDVKGDLNMQFVNMFFGFLASQRAILYGLPIAFATLSTLLVAVRRGDLRLFAIAGVIGGLLPLAHLGTLLALALITPLLFLLFPSRGWFLFHAVWIAVALPQLLTQLGGGAGALAAIRPQLGWVSSPDPWPWFWFKNLGLFLPLVVVALATRRVVPPRAWRFLLAFMALFVYANVIAFQPWDWDNHKILVYWFLAVSILVAALLVRLWRQLPSPPLRAGLVVVALSLVLSGALEDFGQLLGQSQFRMVDAQQVEIARRVRLNTAPGSLLIVPMENRDGVAMFTGRRIFVGYAGWLWTEGVPYGGRAALVRSIYRARNGWLEALAANHIDYVVVGPPARDKLDAIEAAFRERFPIVAQTADWAVYDVRGLRTAGASP